MKFALYQSSDIKYSQIGLNSFMVFTLVYNVRIEKTFSLLKINIITYNDNRAL